MAGLGYKVWNAGDVLAAADVNGYLMDQAVMVFDSSGARGSAIGTATEGMVTYLKDTNAIEYYSGSAWTTVGLDPYTITASTATAYTVSGSDANAAVQFTAAGTVTVTIGTAAGFTAGQKFDIYADSTALSVTTDGGATLSGAGTSGTAVTFTPGAQYEVISVVGLGSDAYRVIGNITAA